MNIIMFGTKSTRTNVAKKSNQLYMLFVLVSISVLTPLAVCPDYIKFGKGRMSGHLLGKGCSLEFYLYYQCVFYM